MGGRLMVAAAAAALLCVGGTARAVTMFTVDSTADTPGNCGVVGQCTLRAAIAAADAAGGSNVVVLPSGTYTLTAGALVVTGTLELDGAGAGSTVIAGGGADRIFDASTAEGLSISGVRITGGASPGGSGGAILVNADTTLRNVAIQGSSSGQGGAIYAGAGDLTIVSSTISGNSASGPAANGGAVAFQGGTLRVLDSVVSNNTVTNTQPSLVGRGGGINAAGNLVLDSSTVSGNGASGGAGAFGGGIAAGARATITNSTISDNTADSVAGMAVGGRTAIVNSTISGNTAGSSQPGGVSTNVSGLEIMDSTIADNAPENLTSLAHVRLVGDILSNPAGHANCDTNGVGSFDSDGYNVSSDGSCHLLGPGDVENEDALLGTLQDNGGGTFTRLPGVGSPALGIIPAGTAVPPTDQRGVFRPAAGADAGAAESATSAFGVTVSAPSTVLSGETFDVVLTLRNRSGATITGASLALGATTRAIGALADGRSDVELFSVTASSPSTCAGAPLVLDFTAAWNGTMHSGSYPVHVTPNCGGVTGKVTASGLDVVGAKVDVCLTTLAVCTEATTNAAGDYTANVPNGSYTVRAYPTAGSPSNAAATTVGPVMVVAPALTAEDVTLTPVGPPPSNVTVTSLTPPGANGLTQVPRAHGATATFTNTCGNPAPTTFTIQSGGIVVFTGQVVQTSPTTFQLTIPTSLHFAGLASAVVGCISFPFNYYDPSGIVRDGQGNPIAGATVTLLRSDSAGGPFAAVANGSAEMSPDNRRNPDQTLDDGSYAWDVVGGFYRVQASKNGCAAESPVLTVPPPATGVDIVVDCAVDQTIMVTRDAPTTAVFGTSFSVAATAPGGAVSYSSTGACSNIGATFAMQSGTGVCTVKFDQAGNAGFHAAPEVTEAVTAQKAPQPAIVVTMHAPAGEAVGASFVVAATATVGPVSYSSTGACTNAGSTFTITGIGVCTVRYDQAGDANYGPAPQVVEMVGAVPPNFSFGVTVAGSGSGTVTSSPAGISCGAVCSALFATGTTVTLTAAPAAGSTFAGWSGACSGAGTCTINGPGGVTATFDRVPPPPVKCVVPNVKGKPLATARRKITAAHCRTGKVATAKSKTVRTGSVVSEKPKPGTKLPNGSKVSVVVSRGKR